MNHTLLVTSRHAIRNNPDFAVLHDWDSIDGHQSVVSVDADTRSDAVHIVKQSDKVHAIA